MSDFIALWCEVLDFAVFSYNISHNVATGYSPFELVYGRVCKLPTEITGKNIPTYNYESYVSELRNKLKKYHDFALEHIIQSKIQNKKYYDRGRDKTPLKFQKNDLVLILNPRRKKKFDDPYEGPFRVVQDVGEVTVLVQRKNKIIKVHKDRLKPVMADFGQNVPSLID